MPREGRSLWKHVVNQHGPVLGDEVHAFCLPCNTPCTQMDSNGFKWSINGAIIWPSAPCWPGPSLRNRYQRSTHSVTDAPRCLAKRLPNQQAGGDFAVETGHGTALHPAFGTSVLGLLRVESQVEATCPAWPPRDIYGYPMDILDPTFSIWTWCTYSLLPQLHACHRALWSPACGYGTCCSPSL